MHNVARCVALDLGVRKISYCEVVDGKVIDRCTVDGLSSLLSRLGPNTRHARVAIEACREAWHVHDKLGEWGHDPVMVDTTRTRRLGIGQHGRKNDRIDAEVLARALEQGLIPTAHVLSPARRVLRDQLGVRRALVEARAQFVTTARGLVRAQGKQVASCDVSRFAKKLEETPLDEATRLIVSPLAATLRTLDEQIQAVELKLLQLCESEDVVPLLATAPGVGLIVAAVYVSVIDEAKRFKNGHQVASYIGLVPSEDSTGGKRRLGGITKKGNGYLRAMLVQAAWTTLRTGSTDDPLRAWAQAIAERRGKRVAVVALARRLSGILWAIWRDGVPYDPKHLGRVSARGLEQNAEQLQVRASALRAASKKLRAGRLPTSTPPRKTRTKKTAHDAAVTAPETPTTGAPTRCRSAGQGRLRTASRASAPTGGREEPRTKKQPSARRAPVPTT